MKLYLTWKAVCVKFRNIFEQNIVSANKILLVLEYLYDFIFLWGVLLFQVLFYENSSSQECITFCKIFLQIEFLIVTTNAIYFSLWRIIYYIIIYRIFLIYLPLNTTFLLILAWNSSQCKISKILKKGSVTNSLSHNMNFVFRLHSRTHTIIYIYKCFWYFKFHLWKYWPLLSKV